MRLKNDFNKLKDNLINNVIMLRIMYNENRFLEYWEQNRLIFRIYFIKKKIK